MKAKKGAWLFMIAWVLFQSCYSPKTAKNVAMMDTGYEYIKYTEPNDPDTLVSELWGSVPMSLQGSYGSIDIRYPKSTPPLLENNRNWNGIAWKGERISAQFVLWSGGDVGEVTLEVNDLKNGSSGQIDKDQVRARFVRYLLTDEFARGCGYRNKEDFAVALVPDPIDEVDRLVLDPETTRPVWVTIDVPNNTEEGIYKGKITAISEKGGQVDFNLELNVQKQTLPQASDWNYHLDLWQNPYAVARYHSVEPWSDEHFDYLEPLIKILANAGQKCITTSIIDKPWNGQTEDPFESMIKWTKKTDGTWKYDYSIFDKWVEFAHKCGITEQINCYTMVPWEMSFQYFDQTSDSWTSVKAILGTVEYSEHWIPFLKDFSKHLKSRKWFKKTTIAMDERPVKAMQEVIKLVKSVDPGYKITLAGGYHEEIADDIYDLCVASRFTIPEEVMQERDNAGKPTTYYTCCTEPYPNNFTFSPPAEGTWQGWHAASRGYGGYLRWAYNSWVKEPLKDSRFTAWPAGDTYMVYPEARTSIRFERMREGIQDYEKIRIIKEQLIKTENTELLSELSALLEEFEISNLKERQAGDMVNKGKMLLNRISESL